MTQTILILDAISEVVAQKMRDHLPPGFELDYATELGDDHLVEIIDQADYAISGQVPVSGRVLRAAKRLKLLHKWGVGVDNFDLEAARECGIKVARTTGSNALSVAEFTLGLIICTLRHIPHGHFGLQHGRWQNWRGRTPFLLSGKTVGLVGFGAIGKAVAGVLAGFDCDTCYYKPNRLDPGEEDQHGVRYLPLAELLAVADVISLHCPLSPNTSGLIDRAALSSMKNTATLINVARGGVVVEQDLIWALENDVIHSAAIDVYEIEPLPAGSPLINVKNLTLTPHLGAMAADTFAPTVERMFANIASVSRGESVPELDSVL
ncbi:MAG: 2-hydroxyacid dehydrogenase [Arenicellales bacterium]|jgi:D-3-phosphoglycerate dehydrogenase|nr:2-hydroxyacid dehydrogenase [Arenicellales bacterium]